MIVEYSTLEVLTLVGKDSQIEVLGKIVLKREK